MFRTLSAGSSQEAASQITVLERIIEMSCSSALSDQLTIPLMVSFTARVKTELKPAGLKRSASLSALDKAQIKRSAISTVNDNIGTPFTWNSPHPQDWSFSAHESGNKVNALFVGCGDVSWSSPTPAATELKFLQLKMKAKKITAAIQDLNRLDSLESKADLGHMCGNLVKIRSARTEEAHYLKLPLTTQPFDSQVHDDPHTIDLKLSALRDVLDAANGDKDLLKHLQRSTRISEGFVADLAEYIKSRSQSNVTVQVQ